MDYLKKNLSHKSLETILEFIQVTIEILKPELKLKGFVSADAYARLNTMRGKTHAYSGELSRLLPHEVDRFLKTSGQFTLRKLPANTIPDYALTITLDQVNEDDVAESLMDVVEGYLNLSISDQKKEIARTLAPEIIDMYGGEDNFLAELRSVRIIEIDISDQLIEKQLMFLSMFMRLLVGLYAMSALTYSHAVTSRYPTEPGSNLHYDQALGVIALIGKLAEEADRIATDFLENFDQIHESVRRLHAAYEQEEDSSSP